VPDTAYKLTCNTVRDLDVITYLDKFTVSERNTTIKLALRQHMVSQKSMLETVEELVVQILREITDLRKSGVAVAHGGNGSEQDTLTDAEREEIIGNVRRIIDFGD